MKNTPRFAIAMIILLAAFMLPAFVLPQSVAAESSIAIIEDMPLLPANLPSGVTLKAYIQEVEIGVNEVVCTQEYLLDSESLTAVTLYLPDYESESAIQPTRQLTANQTAVSASENQTWTIGLVAGETTLRMRSSYGIENAIILDWQSQTDLLSHWGTPASASVRVNYGAIATDEAFFTMFPHGQALDGKEFFWSYEEKALPAHHVVMLVPAIWTSLRTAEEQQDHVATAALLSEITQATENLGIEDENWTDRLTGELQTVIDNNPQDSSARIMLVNIWLEKASTVNAESLNYLLIAADQLEQAKTADTSLDVDASLAEIYYRIAVKLSEDGDPVSALHYLEYAQDLGGLALDEEETRTLYLEWLAQLANQGETNRAIEESQELLDENDYAQLLEYAPPFRSVGVDVLTTESYRQIVLDFDPYEPTIEQTHAELTSLASILTGVDGITIDISPESSLIMTVTETYASIDELAELNQRALAKMPVPTTLIVQTLTTAFPTESAMTFSTEQGLLSSFGFTEEISTVALAEAWEIATNYAEWREIEVKTENISSASATAEAQLLAAVLADEKSAWQTAQTSSYWRFYVDLPDQSTSELLAWGEKLTFESSVVSTNQTYLYILAVGATLLLILLAYLTVRSMETSIKK